MLADDRIESRRRSAERRASALLSVMLVVSVACSREDPRAGRRSSSVPGAASTTTPFSEVPLLGAPSAELAGPGDPAGPRNPAGPGNPDAAVPPEPGSSTTPARASGAAAGGGGGARSFDPRGLVRVGPGGTDLADRAGGELQGRLRGGVVVPFDLRREAWLRVLTPCERQIWIREADTEPIGPFDVVLDPGHGGSDEPGAVGPTGLTEAELNLDVAARAVRSLEREGVRGVLTRELDYRATLAFRVTVAAAAGATALVSVHHNADPDGPRAGPGTETYHQVLSEDSKRLSGLLYEEMVGALSKFSAHWVADRDAGAKPRLSASGEDFYGVLRHAANRNLPAVLAELAFISNPTEEVLLRRPDVREAEGAALARGIRRFLKTRDSGSGFVSPYERGGPAGGGGGRRGCADPS